MKNIFLKTVLLITISTINIFSQSSEKHVWQLLEMQDGAKLWYDVSEIDTIKGDKFDIWVLTVNKPPVIYEGVEKEVYRVKTLYAVDLNTVRYGFLKIRYYDVQNKEIYSFDYDNPPPPENIKYSYPIMENTSLHQIIKAIFGPGGIKSNIK